MVDTSAYKIGVVQSIEDCGRGKPLKACKVDIGLGEPITVVTSATNVREGSRLAVAPVGSIVITEQGEEMTIQKTSVGGVMSEGMFCDSMMLGWTGGAAGIAAQMPDSLDIGSSPPSTKPRPVQAESELPPSKVEGLFEKKLTKEEKKALAEEKRKQRKAAKATNNAS